MHLARAGDPDGDPVPTHVEREFRQYLTCGILAHGFARARCADCGHDYSARLYAAVTFASVAGMDFSTLSEDGQSG